VASNLTSGDASPAVEGTRPSAALPPADSHRARFLTVYLLLALALVSAVVGVVVFAVNSIDPTPKWSSWRPSGGGIGAAKEIADRVAGTYHLPGGAQLVGVIPKVPSLSSDTKTVPISFILLRGSRGQISGAEGVSPSNSIWYSLCGLGPVCSIPTGKPSLNRGTLLRREALELALYTFKYVDGVTHVVAFLPPRDAKTAGVVVYLQKGDLEAQLKRPLVSTLPSKVPLPDALSAHDVQTIDDATQAHVFTIFDVAQTQQGDWVLALAPIPRSTP
jgi:hypothetical protein